MQMLNILIVSFAIISLVFSGCGSKSLEPPVIEGTQNIELEVNADEEEELDLEYVKKIEEEERKQEEKAAEFLEQEATLIADEAEAAVETAALVKLLALTEQQSTETTQIKASENETESAKIQPITQERSMELSQETSIPSTQGVIPNSPTDDSQKFAQQKSAEDSSKDSQFSAVNSTANAQETLILEVPESSAENEQTSADDSKQTQTDEPVSVIVAPDKGKKPAMFMPISRLALVSALKLVSCKNVPVKMEDIHQRLLNTKDINIADRSLRDLNNDRLMPVVHFDFDQIKIKSDYIKLLRQQSSCVMKALYARGDMIVQIEGHADERGSDEYNLALGHRRANAIYNSIMAYMPNPALARILSYGEEFPLDSNSGKRDWDKNRRVEFTLLLKP